MALGGDERFESFVAARGIALQRALISRYGVEVGRDAAAAALAYAWAHWARVADMDDPAAYLYRVGQSEARRHHRWQNEVALPRETAQPADSPVPLDEALAKLSEAQRVAVLLVYSYEYSYREAAEIMGIRVTAVRNHLARGLRKLRSNLRSKP